MNTIVHVTGCNVWSDYSADVLFDDGTGLCFGPGLDCFVRVTRMTTNAAAPIHQRLAMDLQHHYTSHALSRDLAHVGAALKVISTISPRCKFLRVAVNALASQERQQQQQQQKRNSGVTNNENGDVDDDDEDHNGGITYWKSQTVSLEHFVAPPKDDPHNVIVNSEDNSVTVVAVGGNASLWLSPNGAYFDVTWPCRAFDSDGRSIHFVASEIAPARINDRGVNTVKSILCVPHQQRFPVGLAVDAFRKFPKPPEYRQETVADTDFWAPLACWAPLLRVALFVWKEQRGGVCPESVNQFLQVTSDEAAALQNTNPKAAALMNKHFTDEDPVSSNFPPPIPPKVCAVVSPFPKLSIEDAATLLASTTERLHCLPIHDRLHSGASLCVSWSSGDRCCWTGPEAGFARSLIFEDMSCLHIEQGLGENSPMALLHIQNAIKLSMSNAGGGNDDSENASTSSSVNSSVVHDNNNNNDNRVSTARQQQQQHHYPPHNNRTSIVAASAGTGLGFNNDCEMGDDNDDDQRQQHVAFVTEPKLKITAAVRVYSWATGSLEATSRHAPMLPSFVIIPAKYISCAATTPFFALFAARVGSSDVDPRSGRYLQHEVEFIASFLQMAKQTKKRAAFHAPTSAAALGVLPSNINPSTLDSSTMSSYYFNSNNKNNNSALNRSTTAFGNPSSSGSGFEGIGAVRCSSTIPNVGIFTSYQDGTCRCCFDDRTILTLKAESKFQQHQNNNNNYNQTIFSIDEIFVTALDNRAVSTRFRAAACNPQHPMYNYLQYALPFMRYAAMPPEDRAQLCQDPVSMTTCASDFDGKGDIFHKDEPTNVLTLASQLERVIARSQLTLMRHQQSSMKRQEILEDF